MADKITELKYLADKIRLNTFRAIAEAGGGHFGGSLSVVEILTCLYFEVMNVDPSNPLLPGRDRLVLSKGHGGPALYVTLAEKGFFPRKWLQELDRPGGRLPKHVDRFRVPGVDVSTGALGQGLSIGVGMALAAKAEPAFYPEDLKVYVVMGDGECNSGQIWEAAMAASKYRLDNLIGIIDRNFIQCDGSLEDVMPIDPIEDKWRAFGWNVFTVEGHSIPSLLAAFDTAKASTGAPGVIIAETIKGKGVSFMEDCYDWHANSTDSEQTRLGLAELSGEAGEVL